MYPWLLPVFIFLVWFLWLAACIAEAAAVDARKGIPENDRRGISILPGLPVFPLAFWALAWGIDYVLDPWGTITIGLFHTLFGAWLIFSIVRDVRQLRELDDHSE